MPSKEMSTIISYFLHHQITCLWEFWTFDKIIISIIMTIYFQKNYKIRFTQETSRILLKFHPKIKN